MPERNVLERRMRVAAEQTRQAGNLLADDRVALVRHRRGAFLAFAERLLYFSNLRFLQTANLQRELFERRAGNGNCRQQLGVTIALNDLRRDQGRLEAKLATDGRFA